MTSFSLAWTVHIGFLVLICLLAVFFDLRDRRIPNWLTLLGLSVGLMWHWIAPEGAWAFDQWHPGSTGILGSALAALLMLVVFFPLWLLGLLGAGDVKLLAVVGGFFGVRSDHWTQLPVVIGCIFVAGGALSLFRLIKLGRAGDAYFNIRLIFVSIFARASGQAAPDFNASKDSVDHLPYAVAISIGTLVYVGFQVWYIWSYR
jgi:prepilin peptidase CpaA